MKKIARCQCGNLSAQVSGQPQLIGVCHCKDCQQRTGSVFGSASYYRKDQVHLEGAHTVFMRKGGSGNDKRFLFCPTCGTTVYWELAALPDLCAVAVGAFIDPAFPEPSQSWWEQSAHSWVRLPFATQHHQTQ
jgi:hypothetical protein